MYIVNDMKKFVVGNPYNHATITYRNITDS